jgi:hypothetical protein
MPAAIVRARFTTRYIYSYELRILKQDSEIIWTDVLALFCMPDWTRDQSCVNGLRPPFDINADLQLCRNLLRWGFKSLELYKEKVLL